MLPVNLPHDQFFMCPLICDNGPGRLEEIIADTAMRVVQLEAGPLNLMSVGIWRVQR